MHLAMAVGYDFEVRINDSEVFANFETLDDLICVHLFAPRAITHWHDQFQVNSKSLSQLFVPKSVLRVFEDIHLAYSVFSTLQSHCI